MPTILVVEDEPVVLRQLAATLCGEFDVVASADPEEALGRAKRCRLDGAVIDLDLPKKDGYRLSLDLLSLPGQEHLRPVFVTGHIDHARRVEKAARGRAEVMMKDAALLGELAHAVRYALLQRGIAEAGDARSVEDGPPDSVYVNFDERKAAWRGKEVEVPDKPFELLQILIRRPRFASEEDICRRVWDEDKNANKVYVNVLRLRQALGLLGPQLVGNARGGYRLCCDPLPVYRGVYLRARLFFP